MQIANPYEEDVQDLIKLTNLRVVFKRLHTLGINKCGTPSNHIVNMKTSVFYYYYYCLNSQINCWVIWYQVMTSWVWGETSTRSITTRCTTWWCAAAALATAMRHAVWLSRVRRTIDRFLTWCVPILSLIQQSAPRIALTGLARLVQKILHTLGLKVWRVCLS